MLKKSQHPLVIAILNMVASSVFPEMRQVHERTVAPKGAHLDVQAAAQAKRERKAAKRAALR